MCNPTLKVCQFGAGDGLAGDAVLYKYFSVESFLYLLEFRRLLLQPITNWPDAYEGSRYEFLRRAKNTPELIDKARDNYLGSCWSLQQDDPRLHDNKVDHTNANEELEKHGSAAMWESYCKNGGVRVATSLSKLITLLSRSLGVGKLYHGGVCYEAENSWNQTLRNSDVVCTLFVKRIAFRHEAEYRFIFVPDDPKSQIYPVEFDDFFDFIDEVLIAPTTADRRWVSRTIYNLAAGVSIGPHRPGSNHKNGKEYCRISQLYGPISHLIGHGNMS